MINNSVQLATDPVDVAEQQRDYDETYGTPEQRAEDRYEHALYIADMERDDEKNR